MNYLLLFVEEPMKDRRKVRWSRFKLVVPGWFGVRVGEPTGR